MKSGWSRKFNEPIPLPKGRQLVTLKDAGEYITKLPKAEHTAAEWQTAMKSLMLVATSGGPTMLARIGIMRALHRNVPPPQPPDIPTPNRECTQQACCLSSSSGKMKVSCSFGLVCAIQGCSFPCRPYCKAGEAY
jgi:hypothetical protein